MVIRMGLLLVAITGLLVTTAAAADVKATDPETSLRVFLTSILLQDAAELRRVVIPTDEKELAWLLKGKPAPPEVHDQIREHFKQAPIKRLKPGDKVTLPGGQTITVTPREVGPDRMVLHVEGDPVPIRVAQIKGQWLVDPRPLIAARKAADESRKRGEKQ